MKCIHDALLARTGRHRRPQVLVRIRPGLQPVYRIYEFFISLFKLPSPSDVTVVQLGARQRGTSLLRQHEQQPELMLSGLGAGAEH
jgi:hypothetical protein